MAWFVIVLICAAFGCIAFIAWRKWIAPWRRVEDVITQIGRGERPRTFLMEGSAPAQRIGFQLEKIVSELEQLQKQIAKRESGMQTIFSAMQDALLVVDSNRQVILTNQTFRKLFDAPEISVATPLLEIVRDPTLDRLLTDAFRGDGAVRCELTLDASQIELHAVATKNDGGRNHRRTGFVSRHHGAEKNGSSPAGFRGERFARVAHATLDLARLHRDVAR